MPGTPSLIRLPSTVYDDSIDDLVDRLADGERTGDGRLILDFQDAQFLVPAALVVLLSTIMRWEAIGRPIGFANFEQCECFRYLQRMDFFELSGMPVEEEFHRHDPSGRFVPLRRVDSRLAGNVDKVCSELAACIFPALADSADPEQTGPLDMIEFAASELINNVIQHARGVGFVAAQVYPRSGLVRLAVADSGIGIRRSFEETQPGFWDPKMSDLDAVRTALRPKVSSKIHLATGWGGGVNAGVGLSVLKEVASQSHGMFTLLSGTGFYQHNHQELRRLPSELSTRLPFQGTLCALQLPQERLVNLQQILLDAKKGIGLIDPDHRFDDLFK